MYETSECETVWELKECEEGAASRQAGPPTGRFQTLVRKRYKAPIERFADRSFGGSKTYRVQVPGCKVSRV